MVQMIAAVGSSSVAISHDVSGSKSWNSEIGQPIGSTTFKCGAARSSIASNGGPIYHARKKREPDDRPRRPTIA